MVGLAYAAVILTAALVSSPSAFARQGTRGAEGNAGLPGVQPVPAVVPAAPIPGEVRAVLERAQRAYAALTSYRDRAEVTFDLRGRDAVGEAVEQSTTNEIEFLFQRPGRFAVRTDEVRLISNGQTVWAIMEQVGQYTQSATPTDIDASAADPVLSLLHQHRPALVLLGSAGGGQAIERFFRSGTVFEGAAKESRKGRAGTRIRGVTDPAMPGMGASPFSAWLADDTGLLEEVRIDLTATFANMLAGAPDADMPGTPKTIDKAEVLYAFSAIRANETVDASAFEYTPPPSMKKVDAFEFGSPEGGAQMAFIGQPAPAFAGQTLSGDEVSLEGLRGKVVVLDFWATWCAPCVAVMPQVQNVASRFAGRNVVVIGINQDRAGSEDKVREFLAARNINFRQILDFEGELGSAYRVSAIPCSVIIDAKGIIQDIDLGGEQNLEQKLTDRIEAVLRGETIHSAEALARFAQGADDRQMPDDDTGPSAAPVSAGPETLNPSLLSEGERSQGVSAAAGGRMSDTTGDGRAEFVAPDYSSGGLVVISPDGATVEKVRLRGAPRGFIGYASPAQIAGPRGWLVATTEGYSESPVAVVRYHDAEGDLGWSFTVPTPAGAAAQVPFVEAADLDGDSRIEVVVLAAIFPRDGAANPGAGKAWMFVLDSAGRTLSARQVGSIATGAFLTTPGSQGLRTIVVTADNAVKRFTFDNRKR